LLFIGAEVKFGFHANEVIQESDKYVVKTKDGKLERFDCVIFTIPSAQILELNGGAIHELIGAKEWVRCSIIRV